MMRATEEREVVSEEEAVAFSPIADGIRGYRLNFLSAAWQRPCHSE